MELTLGEVASVLGASTGAPERRVRGYSIDSRTLTAGQLFFAIRGPHFDGHDFLTPAFERGAVGAVVERRFADESPLDRKPALLGVPNTTEALQRLAQTVRRKWVGKLIAITGSAGKSTVKEMTAAILAQRFSVLKSPGNLNNHFGLPLTLLSLEPSHEVAVTELAMSAPGEIALLAKIAEPQVGLVTNVAPVHLQFFASVDAIARAKRELIENLPGDGTAILNHDDGRVRQFAEGFGGRVATFGFAPDADYWVSDFRSQSAPGSTFRVRGPGLDAEFQLPLVGRHNVQNAVAAITASSVMGAWPADCQRALAAFQPLAQRSEIVTLPGEIVLINDCYNSNPLAMEKMLETLAHWPQATRRIVVAGEMLELGPTSPELHRAVGRTCAKSRVDWLIAVRGDARYFLDGAREAGMPAEQARFFSNPEEAAAFCRTILQRGDVVLVKGSRAVHLEEVMEGLQSPWNEAQRAQPALPSS